LDALKEFQLPEGFEAIIEPWPYGGTDGEHENKRYFQGLIFAQDKRSNNPDSNFYGYPLPLIPVMDAATQEIVRIDRLATGGEGDSMDGETHVKEVLAHCKKSEYVPELLENGMRTDLKALNVVQPDGPSFQVDGNLITWQKWRFRVGFNPREGATVHDVHYDGRSVLYRLGFSEMVCLLSVFFEYTNHQDANANRLFHTRMHEHHFTESKLSILVMGELGIVLIIFLWVVIVLVLLRFVLFYLPSLNFEFVCADNGSILMQP
jgi:hypothetical protein